MARGWQQRTWPASSISILTKSRRTLAWAWACHKLAVLLILRSILRSPLCLSSLEIRHLVALLLSIKSSRSWVRRTIMHCRRHPAVEPRIPSTTSVMKHHLMNVSISHTYAFRQRHRLTGQLGWNPYQLSLQYELAHMSITSQCRQIPAFAHQESNFRHSSLT